MAGTVADTALSIIAATASDAGIQLAVNWMSQRYSELCARARYRQLRHYGNIYAPSPITLPTVTATLGSTAITFSSAPVDPVTGNQVSVQGWQIRTNIQWYWIVAHTLGSTNATLATVYSDSNAGAGLNCTILQRYLPVVDPNTRWVSAVIHQRRRKRLRYKPPTTFNEQYAGRTLVGAFPWCWTEAERFIAQSGGTSLDISTILGPGVGTKFIEPYPYSSQQETYTYIYWSVPTALTPTTILPPEIDEYVLREGTLIDVYRYKGEQWAAKGNPEMAAFYNNKEKQQMTIWEKKIQEAQVTDALFHNDVPLEFDLFTDSGEYSGDITTAHDWIISQWQE